MPCDAQTHLRALGFTDYEARAYVALLQQGPVTGYSLARISGIPRPNIYPVLDRLQQRGAATRIEVKGGTMYGATPPKELLERLAKSVEAHLEAAGDALRDAGLAAPLELVRNLQGYDSVMERAEGLVDGARSRLTAGICAPESRRLSAAWQGATARGVESVVLCLRGCPRPCGHCEGQVYRYGVGDSASSRWLVLVADDRELLVAQVNRDGSAVAAVTGAEAVVAMASHFLRNTIAASEIVRSLGPRLAQVLDPATLDRLRGRGLAGPGDPSWLTWALSAAKLEPAASEPGNAVGKGTNGHQRGEPSSHNDLAI